MNQPTMEAGAGAQPYPNAVDIPEVQMDKAPKPEVSPDANPVVSAFETIMQFVKAQEEKGSPQAAAMKQHLTQLVQAVTGAVQGDVEVPQGAPTPQGAAAPPPPAEGPQGTPEGAMGAPPQGPEGVGAPPPRKLDNKPVFDAFKPPEEEEGQMPQRRKKNRNTTIQPVS